MRICFVIRSLGVGGAERQLAMLAGGLQRCGHDVTVCVTYPGGEAADELQSLGVAVVPLHKRSRWDLVGTFTHLQRVLRERAPDIVHGYMPTSNLLALLAAGRSGPAVVWGVRASELDFAIYDRMVRASFAASCRLSPRADLIIANSDAGRRFHVAHGYPADRTVVVPNGIDTARFRRDEAGRTRLRAEWGVSPEAALVGLVGRLDPMKDHATFLRACARVVAARPRTRFVCVGDGPTPFATELAALSGGLGLAGSVLWSPARPDVAAVYSALDVHVSASYFGEGFSNAVAEAMACEVPSVATDIGDARQLVADAGRVVPPRDPVAMAEAVLGLLDAEPRALGLQGRARIEREYGVDRLVARTAALLQPLAGRRA